MTYALDPHDSPRPGRSRSPSRLHGNAGLYPAEYLGPNVPSLVKDDGTSDSVVASHSLIPDAMRHAFATLAVLLRPELPLSRRQHEMIAAVVSATNACFY